MLLGTLLLACVCGLHCYRAPPRRSPSALHAVDLLSDMAAGAAKDGALASPIADELDGISADFPSLFLSKYWQKRPVLIRQYIPDVLHSINITSEMLLGLALEEDVESRIIAKMNAKWKKKPGPFRTVDIGTSLLRAMYANCSALRQSST